jgi:DNA-binding YbaB/EbfC family protein
MGDEGCHGPLHRPRHSPFAPIAPSPIAHRPPPTYLSPMADFMKILQQAQEMQGKFSKIQEELEQITVTGSAGGGMVTVEVTGTAKIKKIKLDPTVVNPADVEMLEDLVVVAVSDAQQKAQAAAQEQMSKLTGGLNLPFKLPF